MLYLIIFAFGLIMGSFFNVCIYRLPQGDSVVSPPSHCISCGARLRPVDMIPVISYISLKGRCRYCGEPIDKTYPTVESAVGLIYLFTFINWGFTYLAVKYMILFSGLVIIFFTDLNDQVIPDSVLTCMFIPGIVLSAVFKENLADNLLGLLSGCGVLLLIAALVPGGMGMGDVKLMAVCGWYLGLRLTCLSLLLAFVTGAAFGLLLIACGRKGMKDMIAFGPFLAAGTLISSFYGGYIINAYMSIFVL